MKQIITLEDIKQYTSYENMIENKEYLKLLINATNIMMQNMIGDTYNDLHKLFGLHIFSYLLQYQHDKNNNVFELIKGWVV